MVQTATTNNRGVGHYYSEDLHYVKTFILDLNSDRFHRNGQNGQNTLNLFE